VVADPRRRTMAGGVRIGTSGWQYRDWRGAFYDPSVPTSHWLEAYAQTFGTVEANGTFYRLPEKDTFEKWQSRTPPSFEFAVKASRFLTHVRRLREPKAAVDLLLERAAGLGSKLGPILLQLPPTMPCDLGRLGETLGSFPPKTRLAVEFRHESWLKEATAELLHHYGAATCLADRRGPLEPQWQTADWGYIRFHEGRARPSPRYGLAALRTWAERIASEYGSERTVYAYFNNDPHGCAPRNALEFARACRRAGLRPQLAVQAEAA
jgi:uncharacterized protein YecE (DUF72 family)